MTPSGREPSAVKDWEDLEGNAAACEPVSKTGSSSRVGDRHFYFPPCAASRVSGGRLQP